MDIKTLAVELINFYESHGGASAWTKGTCSRNAEGISLAMYPKDATPVSWCMLGAIFVLERVDGVPRGNIGDKLVRHIAPGDTLPSWNDSRESYEQLIAALRSVAEGGEP